MDIGNKSSSPLSEDLKDAAENDSNSKSELELLESDTDLQETRKFDDEEKSWEERLDDEEHVEVEVSSLLLDSDE